jgi:hypothetical protein
MTDYSVLQIAVFFLVLIAIAKPLGPTWSESLPGSARFFILYSARSSASVTWVVALTSLMSNTGPATQEAFSPSVSSAFCFCTCCSAFRACCLSIL